MASTELKTELTPPPVAEDPTFIEEHPGGAVRHGTLIQYWRMAVSTLYFLIAAVTIVLTQLIGCPLYFIDRPRYYRYMARTKEHFGVLVTTITQWWSPTVIRITGDRSVRDQITQTPDGRVECHFPERLVMIANHQLYSDWLYLWWIAYTARMHGYIYIILKESLKWLPILGLGMQFYGFIFLARKWEQDKPRFAHRLKKLVNTFVPSSSSLTASSNKPKRTPMWLLIFPEGTNLSHNGRVISAKFANKIGKQDLKHQLLPRSTGLRFCLEQLADTVEWVYDCTVAYEGIPRGKYGQDYFTLYSTYYEGRPPKSVNMYWRRFKVADIPIGDAVAFDDWVRERFYEKDELLEYYTEHGCFPEDKGVEGENGCAEKKWKGAIETEVKLGAYTEILDIFVAVGGVVALYKLIRFILAFF